MSSDWRVARSLETLREQVNQLCPGRSKLDDGTIAGDEHHKQNPRSDHEADINGIVHAMDLTHDPAHGFDSYKFADMLLTNRDPRIKYVISNRRIGGDPAYSKRNRQRMWTWGGYFGKNPHDHHVHISVNADDGDDISQWNLGGFDSVPVQGAPEVAGKPVLQLGSKGEDVRYLQSMLGVAADGDFGVLTANAVKSFQSQHGLAPDSVVGRMTWDALMQGTSVGVAPVLGFVPNVLASVFGGHTDRERSAYDGHLITDSEKCCALPFRFKGIRPRVKVTNRETGASDFCVPEDVGPWNGITEDKSDAYWEHAGQRPQAESGRDLNGRKTNKAGIDLSPGLARAIGVHDPSNWMGRVDVTVIPPFTGAVEEIA